jgi:glutathione S-transferase
MAELTITLGNKNYSSWSLRGWLALKQTGAAFEEVVVPLDRPDSRESILAAGPSGRVPVLRHGALTIWDSLAIGEYLAEHFPAAGLWPAERAARAVARAVTAEMHAGFAALRNHMPMDLRSRHPGLGRGLGVAEDIARIRSIWQDCRVRFGRGGDFLFGGFTLADAAFAPVVTRFVTYEVALEGAAAAYRDAVLAWPALEEWSAAARTEPWVIEFPELQAPRPARL